MLQREYPGYVCAIELQREHQSAGVIDSEQVYFCDIFPLRKLNEFAVIFGCVLIELCRHIEMRVAEFNFESHSHAGEKLIVDTGHHLYSDIG